MCKFGSHGRCALSFALARGPAFIFSEIQNLIDMNAKPSDFFQVHPWSCPFGTYEHEETARRIMKILADDGDLWRPVSADEYAKKCTKSGFLSDEQEKRFLDVVDYCTSPETAKLFSLQWRQVYNDNK